MTPKQWLQNRVATDIRLTTISAVASVFGALVLLFITFALAYAVVGLAIGWFVSLPDAVRVMLALAVVGLLFWGSARTPDSYLSKLAVTTGTFSNDPANVPVPGVGPAPVNRSAEGALQVKESSVPDADPGLGAPARNRVRYPSFR